MEDLILINPTSLKQDFIDKAKAKFGDRFDYSKVKYKNKETLVTIIDTTTGEEFHITPRNHLRGETGLSASISRIDTAEFIRRSKEMWGEDAYDYSKTHFIASKQPITLICRKHNYEFIVPKAQNHISKSNPVPTGCPYCHLEKMKSGGADNHAIQAYKAKKLKDIYIPSPNAYQSKLTEEERQKRNAEREAKRKEREQQFLHRKAKVAEYYDVECMTTKQIAQHYASIMSKEKNAERMAVKKAQKAKERAERKEQQRLASLEKYRAKAIAVHGDAYDYSQMDYVKKMYHGKEQYVLTNIICPVHGPFETKPMVHIDFGCKCAKCVGLQNLLSPAEHEAKYMAEAKRRFGDRFDYSEVKYKNKRSIVTIRCKEHDYKFKMRLEDHARSCSGGCPLCAGSAPSEGEIAIMLWLQDHKINFEREHKIFHDNIFCKRQYLKVDFYLPDYNLFIEYNGEQHYKDVPYFFDKNYTLEDQQERDETLRLYCKANKIELMEIPYTEFDNIKVLLNEKLGFLD